MSINPAWYMKPKNKKILLVLVIAILAALTGVYWLLSESSNIEQQETLEKIQLLGFLRADWYLARGDIKDSQARRSDTSVGVNSHDGQAVHLLFLGVDRRTSEQGRADAIHLLRFEPGRITLLSVPRDVLFSFRGDTIADKLNHTYAAGGAQHTLKAVETILNIKIDGYLEVDLRTFIRVAQIAKTLTLNGKLIGAELIFEHIDGLLTWLRNRSFPGGDIRRITRQHLFIGKSLDGILTLYQSHPGAFKGIVNGALKMLPGTISARQVMLLCQIYSGDNLTPSKQSPGIAQSTAVDGRHAWSFARHPAIQTMERFVLPGQTVIIDIQSGREIPPPTDTHHVDSRTAVTQNASPISNPQSDTRIWHVWRGSASLHDSRTVPLQTTFMEETGVISFYQIDREKDLARMLAEWRAKSIRKNYEDKDELLK